MAPLLLSHAIAYDCYCYCNPWPGALRASMRAWSSLPLFNGGAAASEVAAHSLSGICHPATLPLSPTLCMFVYVYGLGQRLFSATSTLLFIVR